MTERPGLLASDYRLDQLTLAPSWGYVTWNGTQHVRQRIYLLALATNTAASEPGLLVGIAHTAARGWFVVDLEPDFCGLLSPDQDITTFNAANPCGHTP